jgi:hypothetical protein
MALAEMQRTNERERFWFDLAFTALGQQKEATGPDSLHIEFQELICFIAETYSFLEETDKAFEWLEKLTQV